MLINNFKQTLQNKLKFPNELKKKIKKLNKIFLKEIEDLLKKETGLQKEVINMSKEKSNLLNKISAAEESALANFRR